MCCHQCSIGRKAQLRALRLAVGEVATRDYLRRELEELRDMLAEMQPPKDTASKDGSSKTDSADRRSKKLG